MAREHKVGFIITGDGKGAVKAIQLTKDEVDKLNATTKRASKDMGSSFESLKNSLFSIQTAVGALATGAFATLIKRQIDAGDEIQKLSQRLGASTEALSQYRYVAERTGVTFENITDGWRRQTRVISEAARGTGEARKVLDELGVSAKELARLAPDKQFEILADAMVEVEQASDKVRIAQKLWDSGNVRLIQSAQGGSKALLELRQRADDVGRTLTQVEADAMADFNDQLTDMSSNAQGFFMGVTKWMLPALSDLFKALQQGTAALDEWLDRVGLVESKSKTVRLANLYEEQLSLLKEIQNVERELALPRVAERQVPAFGNVYIEELEQRTGITDQEAEALRKRLFDLNVELVNTNDQMIELQKLAGEGLPKALGGDGGGGAGGSVDKFGKSLKGASKEVDTFDKELRSLLDRLDPIGKRTRDYIKDVQTLMRAKEEGIISIDKYKASLNELAAGFQASFVEKGAESNDSIRALTVSADPFAEAWIGAIERVDDAFVEMWKGTLDGFDGFAETLKNAFLQLLAELAHAAITRPLIIQPLMGAFGLGGSGGAAGGVGGLLNIASLADSFMGSPVGGALGGLFGIGSMSGGTAGMTSLIGAGGAVGSNFISGGAGIATALPQATGLLSGFGAVLPYLGPIAGLAMLSGIFGGDDPSPHYGATGGLGQLTQNYSRDLDSQSGQQVQQILDAMNVYEQSFFEMLSDAQKEALTDFMPRDLVQVHLQSEHELALHMLYRAQEALKVADEELHRLWTEGIDDILDYPGGIGIEWITLADYERLIQEIIVPPFLEAQEEAERLEQETERFADEMAEKVEGIKTHLADLANMLNDVSGVRESINAALIAFGGRAAPTLEGMRGQVLGELDISDLDAVRERLTLAEEYKSLVVETYNQQIADVQKLAAAEEQRVAAANAAGAALLRWVDSIYTNTSISPLGPAQQTLAAGSQYQTLLSMARAGDIDSAQRLPGGAQTYLTALRGTSATSLEYARAFGGVANQVGGVGRSLSQMVYDEEVWRSRVIDLEQEANQYLLEIDELLVNVDEYLISAMNENNRLLSEILLQMLGESVAQGFNDDWSNSGPGPSYVQGGNRITDYVPQGGTLYAPPAGYYWSPEDFGGYSLQPDYGNRPPPSLDPFVPTSSDLTTWGPSVFSGGGIARGPASGYTATLHGTEAVIPLDSGHVPLAIDFSSLIAELRDLRRETVIMRELASKRTMATLSNYDTQQKWDRDGLPAERTL